MKESELSGLVEEANFSHLHPDGSVRMVDVGHKEVLRRVASAECRVECSAGTVAALRAKALPKGDVLTVAKIAGIQAAKRTDALIPLCHGLPLSCVDVVLEVYEGGVRVFCTVATDARTGVEMEALTGASIAALTIYDMCKSVDKNMKINSLMVSSKVKERIA